MSDHAHSSPLQGHSRPFYRRDHRKADGRILSLYGFAPHQGTPVEELLRPEVPRSELRRDPLRGSWSLYAPHRQARTFLPSDAEDPLSPARAGGPLTEIPFTDFEIAVFENRFPSLGGGREVPLSPFAASAANGRCEVVVYTSEPSGSLANIDRERRILLIETLVDRYRLLHEAGAAYVMPFENRGREVGVTLAHPHGQIYAFDTIPAPQAHAMRAFASGFDLLAEHASWRGVFDVVQEGGLVSFCPPFGRFPYEIWVMPQTSCPGPWALDREGVEALAFHLGEVTRRLDQLFGIPMPLMMGFQAAPREAEGPFQFTVQFYPMLRDAGRLKYLAGVEQFTGVFTVDIVPEMAAQKLRAL